jgi:hypothetical protein
MPGYKSLLMYLIPILINGVRLLLSYFIEVQFNIFLPSVFVQPMCLFPLYCQSKRFMPEKIDLHSRYSYFAPLSGSCDLPQSVQYSILKYITVAPF